MMLTCVAGAGEYRGRVGKERTMEDTRETRTNLADKLNKRTIVR